MTTAYSERWTTSKETTQQGTEILIYPTSFLRVRGTQTYAWRLFFMFPQSLTDGYAPLLASRSRGLKYEYMRFGHKTTHSSTTHQRAAVLALDSSMLHTGISHGYPAQDATTPHSAALELETSGCSTTCREVVGSSGHRPAVHTRKGVLPKKAGSVRCGWAPMRITQAGTE